MIIILMIIITVALIIVIITVVRILKIVIITIIKMTIIIDDNTDETDGDDSNDAILTIYCINYINMHQFAHLPRDVTGIARDDIVGCTYDCDRDKEDNEVEEEEEEEDGTETDIILFCDDCGVLYVEDTVIGKPFNAAFLAATIAALEVTKTPNLLLLLNFFTTLSPSKRTVGALNISPNSKSPGVG